ncbi:hypothetical protein GCM10022419_016060 [Nonomuraea rosea]|uniref:Uncharacterized protein n=1 Tax=Nonomuraea rosea TaxID=638574 RepID=A0ABP6VN07_9ACTN
MPLKTYTVTISGSEREDGEAPYTWVVSAHSPEYAESLALSIHLQDARCVDMTDLAEVEEEMAELRVEELREGLPPADCGYHWNDERTRV